MSSINQWFAGTSGGEGATSSNASSWTIQSSFHTAFGTHQVNNACHNRNATSPLWVVVGAAGAMATSTDGTTWSSATSGFSTTAINAVAYDNSSTWVAGGASKKAFYSTAPGTSWTACTLPSGWSSSTVIVGVAHDFVGHWLMVGNDGSTAVAAQSPDGHTWTAVTLPTLTGTFVAMIHDHLGLFVAVTSAGECITSPDRTTWTTRTALGSTPYGPSSLSTDENPVTTNYFVGCTSSHIVQTSTFSSWTFRDASPGSGVTNMCTACDGFTLYGAGGTPAGSNEFIYQTEGSSLGTGVTIGFSNSVTTLSHSTVSNKVGIRETITALSTPLSTFIGTLSLADSAATTTDSFYLVDVLQSLTVTGNGTATTLVQQINNLFVTANAASAVGNKATVINGLVESCIGSNVVGVIFVNTATVTANITASVTAIYNQIESMLVSAFGTTSATSLGHLLNAVVVIGNGGAHGIFGFYQSITEAGNGTISQVQSIDTLQAIADSAVAQAIVANHLTVPIFVANAADVTDAQTLIQHVLNVINVGGIVAIDITLGDVDYTAWALNTKALGATQYTNFTFNSFCELDDTTYGARADGIYALRGDTDAGEAIVAELRTAQSNLGSNIEKRCPEVYLGAKTDGKLVLKVVTTEPSGSKTENWYNVEPRKADAVRGTRVKIGRGLKSAYWQFALSNVDGSTLELASLEPMPVFLDRRVS